MKGEITFNELLELTPEDRIRKDGQVSGFLVRGHTCDGPGYFQKLCICKDDVLCDSKDTAYCLGSWILKHVDLEEKEICVVKEIDGKWAVTVATLEE